MVELCSKKVEIPPLEILVEWVMCSENSALFYSLIEVLPIGDGGFLELWSHVPCCH
jgi:hypothetical protein